MDAKKVLKLSGIGCSSKSPAYFLSQSHGFNSVHGRMPSVATGALLANKTMAAIGVSGDGDTGAIGIGQFVHLMRRNLPMVYIIEDNGCYGLTKGQFSPTADVGSTLKNGVVNDLPPIDTCILAIELGATFVARSFSGDKKQLSALLKAAMSHKGTAMLDVLSPCVTFNDHEGSTKSYSYVKDHEEPLADVSFVPFFEDITIEHEEGTTREVALHDGSKIVLKKLDRDYDPTNKAEAMKVLHETADRGEYRPGCSSSTRPRRISARRSTSLTSPWRRCRWSARAPPAPSWSNSWSASGKQPDQPDQPTSTCPTRPNPAQPDQTCLWNARLPSSSPTPSRPGTPARFCPASSRPASASSRCVCST